MKQLASASQVDKATEQLARDIVDAFGNSQPLFVALLRGAAPFASKLMFAIARHAPNLHPELDYMTVSAYGEGRHAGTPHVAMGLAPDTEVKDRVVIVLDDVLDKGVTFSFVSGYLTDKGARSVKLAVLVEKDLVRQHPKHADFTCFHAGPEWLTGMGMDDARVARDGFRWLNEIRIVEA